MADISLPRVLPNERPSIFSRETAAWGLVAGIAGVALGVVAGPALLGLIAGHALTGAALTTAVVQSGVVGSILGITLGANYGSVRGIARQQRESMEGRPVYKPTYLNNGIVAGLLALGVVATIATGAGLLFGIPGVAAAGVPHAIMTAIPHGFNALMASIPALSAIGTVVAAGAAGSYIRKQSMKRDYVHALQVSSMQGASGIQLDMGEGASQSQSMYKGSVNPLEAALLEARQSAAASKGHASAVADRIQASEATRS